MHIDKIVRYVIVILAFSGVITMSFGQLNWLTKKSAKKASRAKLRKEFIENQTRNNYKRISQTASELRDIAITETHDILKETESKTLAHLTTKRSVKRNRSTQIAQVDDTSLRPSKNTTTKKQKSKTDKVEAPPSKLKKSQIGNQADTKVAQKKSKSKATHQRGPPIGEKAPEELPAPNVPHKDVPKVHESVRGYEYAEKYEFKTKRQLEKLMERDGVNDPDLFIYRADRLNLINHRNRYVILNTKQRDELGKKVIETLPIQEHHIASNKNGFYIKRFASIADEFDLSLDGSWNKVKIPHKGRHPNEYHDFVLNKMEKIKREAKDAEEFTQMFSEQVKSSVVANPEILRYSKWEKK